MDPLHTPELRPDLFCGPAPEPDRTHPAQVIEDAYAQTCLDLDGEGNPGDMDRGADLLREYEHAHRVAFLALDTDALDRVRRSLDLLDGGGSVNGDLVLADLAAGCRVLFASRDGGPR